MAVKVAGRIKDPFVDITPPPPAGARRVPGRVPRVILGDSRARSSAAFPPSPSPRLRRSASEAAARQPSSVIVASRVRHIDH